MLARHSRCSPAARASGTRAVQPPRPQGGRRAAAAARAAAHACDTSRPQRAAAPPAPLRQQQRHCRCCRQSARRWVGSSRGTGGPALPGDPGAATSRPSAAARVACTRAGGPTMPRPGALGCSKMTACSPCRHEWAAVPLSRRPHCCSWRRRMRVWPAPLPAPQRSQLLRVRRPAHGMAAEGVKLGSKPCIAGTTMPQLRKGWIPLMTPQIAASPPQQHAPLWIWGPQNPHCPSWPAAQRTPAAGAVCPAVAGRWCR